MCLSDSITAGFNGVTDYDTGYRGDLLTDLTAANRQIQFVGTYDPTPYTGAGYDVAGFSPALTAIGQNFCARYSVDSSLALLNNLNADTPSPNANVLGVHPTDAGYLAMAGAVEPAVAQYVTVPEPATF